MDIEKFKEFLNGQLGEALSDYPNDATEEFYKVAVEFADIHVKKALQKASREAQLIDKDGHKCLAVSASLKGESYSYEIDKHSITNAYPKEFIMKNKIKDR